MDNANTVRAGVSLENTAAPHTGASHGSVKSYVIGFILAVVLTVVPFKLVLDGRASHSTILASILALGLAQILVHLVYFLHMDTSSEKRWNVMAFAFTVLILVIVIAGSLWIMHNLNSNMMVM